MAALEKIVVITQKTALEELVERFGTAGQARFYVEHQGTSFEAYQAAHDAYHVALDLVRQSLPEGVRHQFVERSFLPNFLFGEHDLVVALGRDGLVVNTAKYLSAQPLVGFNPDPARIDGVLVQFLPQHAAAVLRRTLAGNYAVKRITMVKAALNNGQTLYGVNDLFIGQRSHLSARYTVAFRDRREDQSSSGIIVSTGAGSTGWFRSILTGAAGIVQGYLKRGPARELRDNYRFDWESDYLYFSVREPFISKTSSADIVFGRIESDAELVVTSQMPTGGTIFSDGMEADYLEFASGTVARIGVAERRVNLVVPLAPGDDRDASR
jgi:NAD kinase